MDEIDQKIAEYSEYAKLRLKDHFSVSDHEASELEHIVARLIGGEPDDTEHYMMHDEVFTFTAIPGAPVFMECEHGHPVEEMNHMFHELMHLILIGDVEYDDMPDTPDGVELTAGQEFAKAMLDMVEEPLGIIINQESLTDWATAVVDNPRQGATCIDTHERLWLDTADGKIVRINHDPHMYADDLIGKLNDMVTQAHAGEPIDNTLPPHVEQAMYVETALMTFINLFCASLADDYGERVDNIVRHYLCWMLETRNTDGRTIELLEGTGIYVAAEFDGTHPFLIDSFEEITDTLLQHRVHQMWHMVMH